MTTFVYHYSLKMNRGYIYCTPMKEFKGKQFKAMSLHKILMQPEKLGRSIVVDHIDGNTLNNQRDNLRVCRHKDNMRNRKKHNPNTTSKYKGTHYNKKLNAWEAQIVQMEYIGIFKTEIAAANAYNFYASELFGEYSNPNDVPYMTKDEWESERASKSKTSKYKGVSSINGKWTMQLMYKGKAYREDGYDTEEAAALRYNELATELKGDNARINILE